jgi:hypothetical protein
VRVDVDYLGGIRGILKTRRQECVLIYTYTERFPDISTKHQIFVTTTYLQLTPPSKFRLFNAKGDMRKS